MVLLTPDSVRQISKDVLGFYPSRIESYYNCIRDVFLIPAPVPSIYKKRFSFGGVSGVFFGSVDFSLANSTVTATAATNLRARCDGLLTVSGTDFVSAPIGRDGGLVSSGNSGPFIKNNLDLALLNNIDFDLHFATGDGGRTLTLSCLLNGFFCYYRSPRFRSGYNSDFPSFYNFFT